MRKPNHPKYNTAAWQQLRAQKLRADPYCEPCLECGIIDIARCVDHHDGNPENDAWENLVSMSISCHSRKTALRDRGFGSKPREPTPAIGVDGWPMEVGGGEKKS